ncbi:MAG: efflux RND transporter permease subunit [Cyclonatronaceae bacterium]
MLLDRPVTAFMLVLATFIFGWIALQNLSVDLLPDVDNPNLLVQTEWSGASAREIESRINEPLEALLSTTPGLAGVHSFARQGQSIIALEFAWGEDMDLAFLNAREKLEQSRFFLPQTAERSRLIYTTPADEPMATLSITLPEVAEPGFDARLRLKRWSEQVLTRRLEQVDGIAQAVMVGAVQPEVHIFFDPARADRYDLSIGEIQSAIREANLFSASGEVRDGWYRYSINIESRIGSVEDIIRLPIRRTAGERIIRLGDIAEVEMAEQDPVSFAQLDGQTVLTVLVKKDYGTNTVTVYERMLPELESLRASFPGIQIEVLQESATFISNTITNLLQTLLAGGLLAFLVLFLFLRDPRLPFTVCIAIPVSVFLTFFVMYLGGIQLNIVSLSGLTLGIGLLVDNAIVVLENIKRYRVMGHEAYSAARRGTREIALAVTASTLTTISVFLPLLLLGGFEGAFFRDQAFTLSISLLASLLVALAILPVLVLKFTGKRTENGGSTAFTRGFDGLLQRYERALNTAMRHPWLVAAGVMLLFGLAAAAFVAVPKTLLPETEERRVRYQVRLPGNAALHTSRLAASELTRQVRAETGAESVLTLGGFTDQTNIARIADEGINKFYIEVPVRSQQMADEVHEVIGDYFTRRSDMLAERLPEFTIFSTLLGAGGAPVVIQIVGRERDRSEQAAAQFAARLGTASLEKVYPELVDTWQISFIPERLVQFGLGERQVIDYMESLARGNQLTEWSREDESIALRLFSGRPQGFAPGEIRIPSEGRSILLGDIARIERVAESQQLERIDQTPVLSYAAGYSLGEWWREGAEIREEARQFTQDTGTQLRISGSAVAIENMLADMGRLLLISLLLIYIILAAQYENLKYPLIIIFAVPFAWIGSLLMLWVSGAGLNLLAFMGILILTGIAVNDAILKVDFMRRYLEQTSKLEEAIRLAGRHRFRPVMMTTVTTILGLLPMLIPLGDGYAFRQSLALALTGGLLTSTLLTLFVIPIVFRRLHR